jgi:hypothetical protein
VVFYLALASSAASFPAIAGGPTLRQDKPEITSLEPGAVLERELAGGAHAYSMQLAGGQYAELIFKQRGSDVVVQTVDASGKPLTGFGSESRLQESEQFGWSPILLAGPRFASRPGILQILLAGMRFRQWKPARRMKRTTPSALLTG